MSPSRTGGSQSTTCTGPGDGEGIALHSTLLGYIKCNHKNDRKNILGGL